eukprot:g23969.t1
MRIWSCFYARFLMLGSRSGMPGMSSECEKKVSVIPLTAAVQMYEWGKPGATSAVARLHGAKEKIEISKPYAELWLGTHENGPSYALLSDKKRTLLR